MTEKTVTRASAPCEVPEAEIDAQFRYAAAVAAIHEKNGETGDAAPRCFIQTFGCQQNEADSERIAGLAVLMGYRLTDTPEGARLILVNTCAVRDHAEKKALSIIGQYKHVKDADPSAVIGIGGCMVTQEHRAEQLKHSYPYVSFIFDTGAVHTLPELVYGALTGGGRSFSLSGSSNIAAGRLSLRASARSAAPSGIYGCASCRAYIGRASGRGRA